jgi:hypothetical protein
MRGPDLSERIRGFLLCSLSVLAVNGKGVVHAQTDASPSPLLLVADFNRGVQNQVGGFHNASKRSPSSVSMTRVSYETYRRLVESTGHPPVERSRKDPVYQVVPGLLSPGGMPGFRLK